MSLKVIYINDNPTKAGVIVRNPDISKFGYVFRMIFEKLNSDHNSPLISVDDFRDDRS